MNDDFTSPIAEAPEPPVVRRIEGISLSEDERERRKRRSRSERAKRRRRQRSSTALAVGLVLASAALVGVIIWKYGPRNPGTSESPQPAQAAETVTLGSTTSAEAAFVVAEPTPLFASYRSLRLNLPVPADSLTVIAFHQASNEKALPMESLLPNADMQRAIKLKTGARYVYTTDTSGTDAPDGVPALLQGEVLRLWRSHRTGSTDRCADVGAKAGSPVFAPVSGTVLLVRAYDLYQKYPDYEVHIRPDGWDDVDCVLIHIDKVRVRPGDRVLAGITRIAEVRLLSDRVPHQLGEYVVGGGDHTHMQLNKMPIPGKIEIDDKIYDVSRPGVTITVTPN